MAANKTNHSKTSKEDALEYLSSLLGELSESSRQKLLEFLGELLRRFPNEGQSKSDFVALDPSQGSVISSADDDFDEDDEDYGREGSESKNQMLASADDDVDEEFDLEDDYDD